MPQGKGTYGTKVGRPKVKPKKNLAGKKKAPPKAAMKIRSNY